MSNTAGKRGLIAEFVSNPTRIDDIWRKLKTLALKSNISIL